MRTATPFARTALIAVGSIALAACGGDLTDEETPYNEGNSETAEMTQSGDEAVPAPDGMEAATDLPPGDREGVTPTTVDGVGTDAETDDDAVYQ